MIHSTTMQVLHTNSTKPTKHFLGGETKQQLSLRRNRTKFDYEEGEIYVELSEIKEVIVGPVYGPPALEDQLEYEYEARVGDINFDGLQDIYLERVTPAPANNGTLKQVVLRQFEAGLFDHIVPNTSQIAAASAWPASSIDITLADVNLDGFVDIGLRNINGQIAGVDDLLVFSPAVAYADMPRIIRPIDQDFENFANDHISYIIDGEYFNDRATQVYDPGRWEPVFDCELQWLGQYGWEFVCFIDYEWEPPGTRTVYVGVDDDSAAVWEMALLADSGQIAWADVLGRFEATVNVDIGAGPWCIEVFGNDDVDRCPQAAIAAAIAALADIFDNDHGPSGRDQDLVYITAHPIQYIGFKHVALEYSPPLLGPTTVSGVKVGPGLVTGTLEGKTDWVTDKWYYNMTAGWVVSANSSESSNSYFNRIVAAHDNYRILSNCLPYQASPNLQPGEGYNSNGYANGLIQATGGVETFVQILTPVGWNPAVPGDWFSSSPPTCP